ncbi:structural protein [Cellulophaga phage phi19:1]|uniref:Structural protein n=1 Tax=Cellulophaga phage phi19:1 TaxID=1327970 RepID=R9ZWB5_9CAUD|nr:virion structural protein [Cellulophaga phage phi19:1]AGO47391.1 structural protein [Cellulophaga phage phi19:1]
MKKIFSILILLSCFYINAQGVAPLVDQVRFIVKTTTQMNALTRVQEGSICYNSTEESLYSYDGSTWNAVGGVSESDKAKLDLISITQAVNLDDVESKANSAIQTELDPNLTKSNVEGLGISYTSLSDVPAVSSPLTFGTGLTRTGDNIVLDNPFTTANETTLNSALQSESDPLYSAWDKDYNDLINRPVNLVTYDPLTAQDVQVSVLGGSDSESYILEFDPNGYDYSGEPSVTGTVDQTIIDGSTNAVSGNAVFDGLSNKLNLSGGTMTGELDLSLLMPSSVVSFIGSNTDPFSSGSFKDFNVSDGSTLIDYQFSPTSTALSIRTNTLANQTAYTAKYTLPHTGTPVNDTDLITKGYADATYGSGGGDNFGNHLATEDIEMDGFWLRDVGNITSQNGFIGIATIEGLNSTSFLTITGDATVRNRFTFFPRNESLDSGVPSEGMVYWNSLENRLKAYEGTSYKNFLLDGDERTSGTTANRPSSPATGKFYLDTTLNLPIWYNGTNWIDATGTTR